MEVLPKAITINTNKTKLKNRVRHIHNIMAKQMPIHQNTFNLLYFKEIFIFSYLQQSVIYTVSYLLVNHAMFN